MKKLVLIDGNAIIHRAYHALPPLNNLEGKPTNAVYGFFSMLFKIIENLRPEYLMVCFDKKAPTFRKQMYVGYQAKRPKMSEDLIPQIDIIHNILDSAKIWHMGIDGYEADDLIGTLSKKGVKKEMEVIIVSGDRDLLQLVNKHVLILAPVVGITNMTLFDEAKVKEKFGIDPSQIIDYKALVGDASDNYPGITGIGPKTAMQLLVKYKTLENIYKHLSDVPQNLQEKLAQDVEQAALAKKLATIIIDAPLSLDEENALLTKVDFTGFKKEFEKYNFNSLLKRINNLEQNIIIKTINTEKKENNKQSEDSQMSLL